MHYTVPGLAGIRSFNLNSIDKPSPGIRLETDEVNNIHDYNQLLTDTLVTARNLPGATVLKFLPLNSLLLVSVMLAIWLAIVVRSAFTFINMLLFTANTVKLPF